MGEILTLRRADGSERARSSISTPPASAKSTITFFEGRSTVMERKYSCVIGSHSSTSTSLTGTPFTSREKSLPGECGEVLSLTDQDTAGLSPAPNLHLCFEDEFFTLQAFHTDTWSGEWITTPDGVGTCIPQVLLCLVFHQFHCQDLSHRLQLVGSLCRE